MGADVKRILICDIEATCWSTRDEQGKKPNEVIEIGMCELELRSGGYIGNGRSYVVKPRFTEISPFCTELTGWTQEAVDKGKDITEVLALIKQDYRMSSESVWFSCGEYDRAKLSSDPNVRGSLGQIYSDIENQWLQHAQDPLNPFHSARHFNIKTLFALKHRLNKEMGMDKMLSYIGEKLEGRHHNGMDDALNIAKIVRSVLT